MAGFFYSLERRQNDIQNLMLLNKIQHSLSNVRFSTSFWQVEKSAQSKNCKWFQFFLMHHLKMFTDYFKIYYAPFSSSCGDIFLVNFLTILKRKWAQFERKDEIMMIWDSLFAHNFYLIKKLAIIEIAEAFSQSISWGGLDT